MEQLLRPREQQEDIEWLAELYAIKARLVRDKRDNLLPDIDEEIRKAKDSLDREDWRERQAKADAHCKARGCTDKHICWRYGL